MIRLTDTQWNHVHHLCIEVHRARSEGELLDLVLHRAPAPLGISYTTWNQRSKKQSVPEGRTFVSQDYSAAVHARFGEFTETIASHPVVANLSSGGELVLPEDKIVSMTDFASMRQIRETAIHTDFYRHVGVVDHAGFEATYADTTVMACFISPRVFSEETKLMIHLFRQHLAIAFLRFKETEAEKKRVSLILPSLDHATLTRRERETLPYLLSGKSNSEIAIILGISPRTAEKHVASLIEKSGAENRKILISEARYAGPSGCTGKNG